MSFMQNIRSNESHAISLAVFLGLNFLLIDPLAYHSFTALKHVVFIVGIPAFLVWACLTSNKIKIGWLATIFALRIVWLASTNPDWLQHPSNDGFYLTISMLVLLITINNIDQEKFFKVLLWVIFVSGVLQTAIGFYQLTTFIFNPSAPIKTPFIGSFGTSNGLGIFLTLSFISGAALSFLKRSIYLYALTSFVGIGLFFTESRGAILALIVALSSIIGISAFQRFKTKKQKGLFISALTVVIVLAGIFLYKADIESSSGRWMLWEITSIIIKENPVFGVGHGNYSREYLNYQAIYFENESHADNAHKATNIKQAHNEFLQSFAEGGILSGILLFSMWILPIVFLFKKLNTEYYILNLARLGILVSILIHSLIDSPLHLLPVAIVGYATIATMDKTLFIFPKKLKYAWVILLSVYITFMTIKKGSVYFGHHYWKQGVEHIHREQWSLAINDLEVALERLPNKGELLYQLGAAYIFEGKYTRGIYYIEESKKHFNDRNIYLSEAYGLMKLEKYAEAEESVTTALSMFPTHLAPHLLLGEIYYHLGQEELSKASLSKCINEDIEIKSVETKQISEDAKKLWQEFYGEYSEN
jgi:tetratricopeptide (TPR) repeat protein